MLLMLLPVLTRSLELLLGSDGYLHGCLSLYFTRYVLHVRHSGHGLVHGHGHRRRDRGGHANYDVERAATVLASSTTVTAVLASAALYDSGCRDEEREERTCMSSQYQQQDMAEWSE